VPFLLAVFCFGVAAADALGHGRFGLGGVNLGAAVGNLLALFLADRGPRWLEGVVLLINVPVALVQSASYFQAGKIGLPWVWLGVAIGYAVVGVYKTRQALTV
jgi:hypothetical protein